MGRGVSIGVANPIGAVVCGDCHSGGVGIGGSTTMGRWFAFTIRGTLPGTLFLVQQECGHFVNFNACLVVGLGAAMIGGASVMRVSTGCGSLWMFSLSTSPPITLYSTLCSCGGIYGVNFGSAGGRSHWWFVCMRERGGPVKDQVASLSLTSFRTRPLFSSGSTCKVVMSSSMILEVLVSH
jgi:hypothetical protein